LLSYIEAGQAKFIAENVIKGLISESERNAKRDTRGGMF
jgi:hypothetical protein